MYCVTTFPLAISAKELGAGKGHFFVPHFSETVLFYSFVKLPFCILYSPHLIHCFVTWSMFFQIQNKKNNVFYQQTVVSTSLHTFSWHLWHCEERKKKEFCKLHVNKSLVFLFCLCKVGFKLQLSNQRPGLQCLVVQQLPL